MAAQKRLRKQGLTHAGNALHSIAEDLFVTPAQQKLIDVGAEILMDPGDADDAVYQHSILCQVGMPRKRTTSLTFERTNGSASLLLTAGKLYDGKKWVQQQLPYGPKPRLILINLTSAALVTGSRFVDVGRSTRAFLEKVGLPPQGSEYRSLRKQVSALSACRMQLGARIGNHVVNLDTQPIHRFDVWVVPNEEQQTLWPGFVELSQEYFDGVRDHAVPLDERAVAGLRGSALSLDIYCWLAHRLCRIKSPNGSPVRWEALKVQFGSQEYADMRDFRKEFRKALRQVLQVYRGARVQESGEGLRLCLSPPPVTKVRVQL